MKKEKEEMTEEGTKLKDEEKWNHHQHSNTETDLDQDHAKNETEGNHSLI